MAKQVERDKQWTMVFEESDLVRLVQLFIDGPGTIDDEERGREFLTESKLLLPLVNIGKDGKNGTDIAEEQKQVLLVRSRSAIPLDPFNLLTLDETAALSDVHFIALEKQNEATAKSGRKKPSIFDQKWFQFLAFAEGFALVASVIIKFAKH